MSEATHNISSASEPMRGGFAESIDRWLTAQAEWLADIDELTRAWVHRRQGGIDAARQAVQQISRCDDPVEMLRVHHEWFCGARERTMEDILGLSDSITAMTRRLAGGLEAVPPTVSEPLPGRAEMLKAAGDKPKAARTVT